MTTQVPCASASQSLNHTCVDQLQRQVEPHLRLHFPMAYHEWQQGIGSFVRYSNLLTTFASQAAGAANAALAVLTQTGHSLLTVYAASETHRRRPRD